MFSSYSAGAGTGLPGLDLAAKIVVDVPDEGEAEEGQDGGRDLEADVAGLKTWTVKSDCGRPACEAAAL